MRRWEKVVMRYHQWETSPQMMQKIRPTAGDMAQNTEPMHWSWRFHLVIFLCYVVACKNMKCSAPSKMLMLMQAPNSDWTPTTYKRQNQGYQNFPFLPQKLGFLAQKRPNLAQNMLSWAHIDRVGSFGALLVGGCGARAVSRKTPIYFIVSTLNNNI